MNRNRRRKRKNRQWLFALLFAVSFFAAMPFVVRALGGKGDSSAVQADPPSSMEDEISSSDGANDGSSSKVVGRPDNTPTDTSDVPDGEPSDTSDDIDNISGGNLQDNSSASGSTTEQPDVPSDTQGSESSDNSSLEFTTVDDSYFDDALFIGDSRTVGLSEYGDLQNADFFATTGMSVYNVLSETVSVPSVGKITLDELLGSMTYGKVYLMLGINELGYDYNSTVEKYGQVVDYIREKQPGAIIYVEANLHVTKSRSDSDEVFNNSNIDRFNLAISALANGQDIFYIDVNELFDDESGNLDESYTSDNAHVLGKYYATWCQWLRENAAA